MVVRNTLHACGVHRSYICRRARVLGEVYEVYLETHSNPFDTNAHET